jgi:hypothetical protein
MSRSFTWFILLMADPSGRAIQGVGLRPLAYCDRGFETRRGHGCLSLVSVVCCQVEVSPTGWFLVQRSPTECGVSECDRKTSKNEAALVHYGLSSHWKKILLRISKKNIVYFYYHYCCCCCVRSVQREIWTILLQRNPLTEHSAAG